MLSAELFYLTLGRAVGRATAVHCWGPDHNTVSANYTAFEENVEPKWMRTWIRLLNSQWTALTLSVLGTGWNQEVSCDWAKLLYVPNITQWQGGFFHDVITTIRKSNTILVNSILRKCLSLSRKLILSGHVSLFNWHFCKQLSFLQAMDIAQPQKDKWISSPSTVSLFFTV